MSELLRLQSVGRTFDHGAVTPLRDVSLSVYAGDRLSITGPSGSGKSTLLHIMGGIDEPSAGRVLWEGAPIASAADWSRLRSTAIGMVFQDFLLLPGLTALQNVECAVASSLGRGRGRDRAMAQLEAVGLAGRAGHLPSALSGGERQRVAVARALVNAPRLLLADEPTGNLDSRNGARVADLLFALQAKAGAALVLVTHDADLAARCDRRVVMKDGLVASEIA